MTLLLILAVWLILATPAAVLIGRAIAIGGREQEVVR